MINMWNNVIYYTWKNIRKSYKNIIFKISAPTKDKNLPGGSYSKSDFQDHFEYHQKAQSTDW